MRKYLVAGIFLLVAGIALAADVRRLISVGDINFGSGTFTDTAGLTLYKVNADNVPFSQDNAVKVGLLYYLALAADNGVSSYCLKSAGDNTFYWGVCSTLSDISWDNVAITGGTIDNSVVGGTTPAAGTFTTIATDCVTNTEVSYLEGVTSAIQTQIDSKRSSDNNTFSGPATFDNEVTASQFSTSAADGEHFINVANSTAPTDNVTTGDCYYDNVALQWLCWNGSAWAGAAGDVTGSSTTTFTNKTLDASATGNVLKQLKYREFFVPHYVNQWKDNTAKQAKFLNGTDKATNCAFYRTKVPPDYDNTVAMAVLWEFEMGGTDTGSHNYSIGKCAVGDSHNWCGDYSELDNVVSLSFAGDANAIEYDVNTVAWTTLTNWASQISAGQHLSIGVCRDGDTSDTSTVDSYSSTLTIRYGSVQ